MFTKIKNFVINSVMSVGICAALLASAILTLLAITIGPLVLGVAVVYMIVYTGVVDYRARRDSDLDKS